VHWSIENRTALADAELEYKDREDDSIFVLFAAENSSALKAALGIHGDPTEAYWTIWTTTPWTLPANLAVAFNPHFHYSMVMAEGGTYLVANPLLSAVAQKLNWENYQIVRTVQAEELAQLEYEHPFCARTGKLHPAAFVTSDTGSGFVHIAPGHGMDDYQLGLKVGLPIYCPVDDAGRLALTSDLPREQQMPDSLVGLSTLEKNNRSDANEGVLALLTEKQALAHREKYAHSYPHCWRSKTPIIFRATDQWFIGMARPFPKPAGAEQTSLRQEALRGIQDDVKWIPDWGQNRIKSAVESRPDWCISRQRSWGVPIPAFYDAAGEPILNAESVRKAADLIEKEGSNVWFANPVETLWAHCRPTGWTGPEAVRKGMDTLDVWIDSGSSSRAVLQRRPELTPAGSPTFVPADMYLEGSDQHRGWFQSSLLLSLAGNGVAPFKSVLTHGFMVDEEREKISKSKQGAGGYQKPQTAERYVYEFGADVVRLWVASQDYRNDIVVSEERLKKVGETYRLLRNTLRYQLSNLYDFDPDRDMVPDEQLTLLDRWILAEFAQLEREVAAAYEQYEFHVVYQKVAQFAAVQLSAMYHDIVKDRLYTDAVHSNRRRSTQTVLYRLVIRFSQMLAPMLAFTAEEAWEFIPGVSTASVHFSTWQPSVFVPTSAESEVWKSLFDVRTLVLPELEKARQAKRIGKALDAVVRLELDGATFAVVEANRSVLQELLNVSGLEIREGASLSITVQPASELGWQKCERCWHWEPQIGTDPAYPGICARCADALRSMAKPA
jgi:isoleucyl-tRNA synthetase